jgi:hypothetical protein
VNKALLDTDILSEVGKGIDQTVARNATAYRQAYGFLTLSVISVMEIIQGYQRVGGSSRIQAVQRLRNSNHAPGCCHRSGQPLRLTG